VASRRRACPPTRGPKRLADRLLPTGAGQWVFFGMVAVALSAASTLSPRATLAIDAAAILATSAWCSVNFWRCREAHCLITSAGWGALGVLAGAETTMGHSLIDGTEVPVFLAVLAVAYAFEASWRARHGTKALTSGASPRC